MRYFKLFLVVIFSGLLLNACKENTVELPNDNTINKQETIALQALLKGVKEDSYSSNTNHYEADSLCFQFVYPIQLSYNTQNNITINNFNGLIDAINNQSAQLYIIGIVTPFQITIQNQIQTISSEAEMIALMENCDYFTVNETIEDSFCFDIVFPIQVISETGQNVTVSSAQDFESFINTQGSSYQADIVFPIQIIEDDDITTVTNLYDFIELIYSCNDEQEGCECYMMYAPVCIQTSNGIIEYGNMCFAECDGYSAEDIVPCNNGGDCSIFDMNIKIGDCTDDDSFSLKLDFNYNNPQSDEFEVYALDSIAGMPGTWNLIGTYALNQLPLEIADFPDANTYFQWFKVEIKNSPDCNVSGFFVSPICDNDSTCNCTTVYEPVCVTGPNANVITFANACLAQCAGYSSADFVDCGSDVIDFAKGLDSCFSIQYPVQVLFNGLPITVNSNTELLLYHFPTLSPIPAFVYPIQVNFEEDDISVTIQINSQQEFISNLNAYCD